MTNSNDPAFPKSELFRNPDNETIGHYHGFTKREYACIHLRIPKSGIKEIDEFIVEANRRDEAVMAMQGIAGQPHPDYPTQHLQDADVVAEWAVKLVDALIMELNK